MKVTVGIPSRGRPLELAAAVLSLDKTKSNGHIVDYIIGHDHNDPQTMEVVAQLVAMGLPVRSSFGPRPLGLGEIHNRLISETDSDSVFLLWSDRCVPCEVAWDNAIAMTVLEYPNRVLWMDSHHLVGPGQPITTPNWRKALGDEPVYPGSYPAWFEDEAQEEEDGLVHGFPRVAIWAKCAGPRVAKTNRLWDLPFWIKGFAKTRVLRIARAKKISRAMGLPSADRSREMAYFEDRDAQFLARADELTLRCGADGEPDETYREAKRRFELLLAGLD